jgi:tripartite-type tricarboxylate transporter receptor subunit TctC
MRNKCLKLLVMVWAMPLGNLHAQTSAPAPVRILLGAPAGGTTDNMARTLAQALGQQLGRVVLVENKPGEGGNMAADLVKSPKRLSDATRVAIQTLEVKRRIEMEGAIPAGISPQEFSKFVEAEIVRWRTVVQHAGAKPE